jgi:hypothetical protein
LTKAIIDKGFNQPRVTASSADLFFGQFFGRQGGNIRALAD